MKGHPKTDSRGAINCLYAKGEHDFVTLVVYQNIALEIGGNEFSYQRSNLRVGDSMGVILKALGRPGSGEEEDWLDRGTHCTTLRYNDLGHLVPFVLEFRDGRLSRFRLAPGPEAY